MRYAALVVLEQLTLYVQGFEGLTYRLAIHVDLQLCVFTGRSCVGFVVVFPEVRLQSTRLHLACDVV